MAIEALAGMLGIRYYGRNKESVIAPYVRTMELANKEHEKAVEKLTIATQELEKVYHDMCETCPKPQCEGCPLHVKP